MEPSKPDRAGLVGKTSPVLRVVLDFLSYLEDRESSEATAELLAIPGFEQAFQRAVAQADAGEVVRWAEVRRDV